MLIKVSGGRCIEGSVHISGSKNIALKVLIASLLVKRGLTRIMNVPCISDVENVLEIIKSVGAVICCEDCNVTVDASYIDASKVNVEALSKVRVSILFLTPLLHRCGSVFLPYPGGCDLGSRPIDYHLHIVRSFGASISADGFSIKGSLLSPLQGCYVSLEYPSLGSTEQFLLCASCAHGLSVIDNPSFEPEIYSLIDFLSLCGVRIYVDQSRRRITVDQCYEMKACSYCIPSDRIEVGTWTLAVAALQGELILHTNANYYKSVTLYKILEMMGVYYEINQHSILLSMKKKNVFNWKCVCAPYPYFCTDLQSQLAAALLFFQGFFIIEDRVFPRRFRYVQELQKINPCISYYSSNAIVIDNDTLVQSGSMLHLHAKDLRGASALVIAALAREGMSFIHEGEHLLRGFEDFDSKLRECGLDVIFIK